MSNMRALPIAYVVLRILIVLNWVYGAVVLSILTGLFTAQRWTMSAIGCRAARRPRPW